MNVEFLKRRVIGSEHDPYMIRYIFIRTPWFGIFYHIFYRSDHQRALHDHPWGFLSLILWRGYIEHTDRGTSRKYPGFFLPRPAQWKHRVELIGGRHAHTLVLVGPRIRKWGFWPDGKWCWWRKYNQDTAICEEEIIFADNNDYD